MRIASRFKKWNFWTAVIAGISLTMPVFAANSNTSSTVTLSDASTIEGYLSQIATNTLNTANYLNTFLGTWLNPDNTQNTANLQTNFIDVNNAILRNQSVQNALLPRLNSDLMGPSATTRSTPQANDLLFSSLVGIPYFTPDPRANPNQPNNIDHAYNYIRNASGILTTHVIPGAGWAGTLQDQITYINYYDSVMAIESYNAYVLSDMYAESVNGGPFNKSQQTLMKQASDPNWFVAIGAEPLGVLLRQMLMYQSETFVLLCQLLQTEKQMLAATVMGNTVGILNNSSNEITLRNKAIKAGPGA